jgi:hypothetical protein
MRTQHAAAVVAVLMGAVSLRVARVDAQPAESGLVVRINGAPTVQRGGNRQPLRQGDTIAVGDVIETDQGAKVKILFADDSVLAIGPKSRVSVDEFLVKPERRMVRLGVALGRFKIAIAKFFGTASDYEIRTPTAVAGVRGTVLWGDTDLDAICSLDGSIEVHSLKANGQPARLTAGECVNQLGSGKPAPLKPSAQDLAGYLKEVTLD